MTSHALTDLSTITDRAAKEASVALAGIRSVLKKAKAGKVAKISLHADSQKVVVPHEAFDLFVRILAEMANGNAITIVPVHAELTTQQAADLLNISRPFLITLLEARKIPFRMVGTRRRINCSDLIEYKRKEEAHAKDILEELAAESQRLKLE